jgi:hypothetical protein
MDEPVYEPNNGGSFLSQNLIIICATFIIVFVIVLVAYFIYNKYNIGGFKSNTYPEPLHNIKPNVNAKPNTKPNANANANIKPNTENPSTNIGKIKTSQLDDTTANNSDDDYTNLHNNVKNNKYKKQKLPDEVDLELENIDRDEQAIQMVKHRHSSKQNKNKSVQFYENESESEHEYDNETSKSQSRTEPSESKTEPTENKTEPSESKINPFDPKTSSESNMSNALDKKKSVESEIAIPTDVIAEAMSNGNDDLNKKMVLKQVLLNIKNSSYNKAENPKFHAWINKTSVKKSLK